MLLYQETWHCPQSQDEGQAKEEETLHWNLLQEENAEDQGVRKRQRNCGRIGRLSSWTSYRYPHIVLYQNIIMHLSNIFPHYPPKPVSN